MKSRPAAAALRPRSAVVEHPLAWLVEPLQGEPTFEFKPRFGGRVLRLHGQQCLHFTVGEEPWCGVLVCTFHAHHASLQAEFPGLAPHPVLGKWLYLPEAAEHFERDARRLVALVRARDPRIGLPPAAARKKKAAAKPLRFGDPIP